MKSVVVFFVMVSLWATLCPGEVASRHGEGSEFIHKLRRVARQMPELGKVLADTAQQMKQTAKSHVQERINQMKDHMTSAQEHIQGQMNLPAMPSSLSSMASNS